MAKQKFDGVVEAAHYQPDGQLAWVRAYLRRGPTFSDRVKLDRATLIENLRSGKRYMAGSRLPLLASTFQVSNPLRVIQKEGREVVVTGDIQANAVGSTARDHLEGIPVI
jgi:hypothetical protein